jgi:hypothetical protein
MPTSSFFPPKCTSCNVRLQRYGKTAAGAVRYRCRTCGKTSGSAQKKSNRHRVWVDLLEQYVLDGATYQFLSKIHGITIQTLETHFHALFEKEPPVLDIPEVVTPESYLLIDGKWFGKTEVMMVYRRSDTKTILRISFLRREYGSQIARDLEELKKKYSFTCVVSDGGTGIRKGVVRVFGHIPHQHCLAHAHRMASAALGKHPKDPRLIELKFFTDHLWKIESKEALKWWTDQLKNWGRRHFSYLDERRTDDLGRRWFAHPGARKALRILIHAAQHSFVFLDHPLLPRTSNAMEASIGVFTDKKRIHRGLKQTRTHGFLQWFVYFYNTKKLSQNIHKTA